MEILVSGGAGYIGSHTVIELLKENNEIIIVDDFSNSSSEVIDRIEGISGKKVTLYECDMTDEKAFEAAFKNHNIEMVIHFAGYKAVGESVAKPLSYYKNNLISTMNLLGLMNDYKVKRIVFSSSATVYGVNHESPLDELMSLSAINPYGQTKLMIEQMIQDQCASDSELSAVLLRYFNPIGAHESGLIGENPLGIPNNLVPYISKVAAGNLEKVTIFGDDYPTPDGTGIRDYIHVADLALGHVKAVDYAISHVGCEVFNLGTGKGTSVLELIHTFASVNQITIPYVVGPRRDGDVAVCFADAHKSEELLGWRALKNLEQMCEDTWRWQKSSM